MTAFEDLDRGDIVWASDPLSEKGRPMLVLGAPQLPNHGPQLITVLISTKTYHEQSITKSSVAESRDRMADSRRYG